jgi:hypothetical protein
MRRLWSVLLASLVTAVSAGPALSQGTPPSPNPVTPPSTGGPTTTAPTIAPYPTVAPQPAMPSSNYDDNTCDCVGCGNLCHRRRPIATAPSSAFDCGCAPCGPPGRMWGSVDYILWKALGDKVPFLVSSSPAGTAFANAGVMPGASPLFGGDRLDNQYRSGVRLEIGGWLNEAQTFGIQFGGFLLQDTTTGTTFASDGTQNLARPFFSTATGPASQLVAFTDPAAGLVVSGAIDVHERTSADGFDLAFRSNMCCGSCWRIDTLIGYKYFHLSDRLSISQAMLAGPASNLIGVPPGTQIAAFDQFDTDNDFHGAEVGFAAELRFAEKWVLEGTAKASYGWIGEHARITGGTTFLPPGAAAVTNVGGLLALQTNIGDRNRGSGEMLPEFTANLGYDVNSHVRVRVGYTFIYLNDVFRAGPQIDTNVNPFFIPPTPPPAALGLSPNPARPATLDQRSDYYLHGINVGVEIRF